MQIVDPFSGDDYELVTKATWQGAKVGALMGANRVWERGGDAIAAGRTAATTGGRRLVQVARENPKEAAFAGGGAVGGGALGLSMRRRAKNGVEKSSPMPGSATGGNNPTRGVRSVSPSTAMMESRGGHANKLLVKTGKKTGGKADHLAHYRGKKSGGRQPGLERYGKSAAFEGEALIAKRGTPMSEMQRSGRRGMRLGSF